MATKNQIDYCLSETYKHIKSVSKNINIFVRDLINRAEIHDESKLEEPELSIFAEKTAKLALVEYGSEEYKKLLEEVKPAIEHHYSRNRHHTEFHKNGINDMDLLDLIELLCDWRAATERNKNGNLRKSLDINAEKYNIDPQLKSILRNTIDRYL